MPVRTCVGCRQRAEQSLMIRIVATGSSLVVDRSKSMPGRGAHLHPTSGCLAEATKRRAFGRALRVEGPLDLTALEAVVAGQQ